MTGEHDSTTWQKTMTEENVRRNDITKRQKNMTDKTTEANRHIDCTLQIDISNAK